MFKQFDFYFISFVLIQIPIVYFLNKIFHLRNYETLKILILLSQLNISSIGMDIFINIEIYEFKYAKTYYPQIYELGRDSKLYFFNKIVIGFDNIYLF